MKRLFNIFFATLLLAFLVIPIIFIAILVRFTSKGKSIHWSNRVGKNNIIYRMPKFRTMVIDSPNVATHLLSNPEKYLTPIGGFLRRTSLDEIPQLFSVLKGDMTFIGPRPALSNQFDLIDLRQKRGIHKLVPGITGWAQVNGRDAVLISEKVALDEEYKNKKNFLLDLRILWMTFLKVVGRNNVLH
jgi:O-antigen biosynthesis protein WbqP